MRKLIWTIPVALSIIDGWLTIQEGGLEIEGNPLMRLILSQTDWIVMFWLYKTLGVAVFAWILSIHSPKLLWLSTAVLVGVLIIHGVVLSL